MKTSEREGETKIEVEPKKRDDSVRHSSNPAAFDAAIAKWIGSGRARMQELGFATTEEYMKAIRGR